MDKNEAVKRILNEYESARKNFPKMRSMHEGYAIIYEEMDELWEEIKKFKLGYSSRFTAQEEAIHVGAMILAFLIEVC